MANVDIRNWLTYVEGQVLSAPTPAILQAIRDTLQEFLGKSLFWRDQLPAIDVVVSTTTYDMIPPAPADGVVIAEPLRVEHDGNEVVGRSEAFLDRNLSTGWRTATAPISQYWYRPTPQQIRIVLMPTEAKTGGLVIWAALKSSADADVIPEFIWEDDDIRDGVAHGVKAKLFFQVNVPWSNPEMGGLEQVMFDIKVNEVRMRAEHSDVLGVAVADPQFLSGFEGEG